LCRLQHSPSESLAKPHTDRIAAELHRQDRRNSQTPWTSRCSVRDRNAHTRTHLRFKITAYRKSLLKLEFYNCTNNSRVIDELWSRRYFPYNLVPNLTVVAMIVDQHNYLQLSIVFLSSYFFVFPAIRNNKRTVILHHVISLDFVWIIWWANTLIRKRWTSNPII